MENLIRQLFLIPWLLWTKHFDCFLLRSCPATAQRTVFHQDASLVSDTSAIQYTADLSVLLGAFVPLSSKLSGASY